MRIIKNGQGTFAVFKNETEADKWHWFFGSILNRPQVCFGHFFNAYKIK